MNKKITHSFRLILAISILSFLCSASANGALVIDFVDQGSTIGVSWSGGPDTTAGFVGGDINLTFASGSVLQPGFVLDLVPTANTLDLNSGGTALGVIDFSFFGTTDEIIIDLGASLASGAAYNATGSAVINQSFSSIFANTGSFTAGNDGPDFGTTTVNVTAIPEPSSVWFGVIGCTIVSMFSFLRRRGLIAAKSD